MCVSLVLSHPPLFKGEPLNKSFNSRLCRPWNSKQIVFANARAMANRTLPPLLIVLAMSGAAHAQGTVDLSGVTTAMSSVQKTCMLGGAICVVIGIVFGVFQFMGRNIAQGFMAIGGGLLAGIVIGFAPQWVSSLTGQSVSMVVTHAVSVLA